MNARLLMAVYESALPPGLKVTCGALALFADAHGGSIYPSLARVGWLIGKSERQVRSDIAALVDCGVLIELTPRQGGRGRTTLFRLDATALPKREPFYSKGGTRHPGNGLSKAEAHFRLSNENPEVGDGKPGNADRETRNSDDVKAEADCRGSLRDQELISDGVRTAPTTARFDALAKAPAEDGNVSIVRKIAFGVWEGDRSLQRADRFGEFVELVKQACADGNVDYGGGTVDPFVVHKACTLVQLAARTGQHRASA
jgi:hypothetical protein